MFCKITEILSALSVKNRNIERRKVRSDFGEFFMGKIPKGIGIICVEYLGGIIDKKCAFCYLNDKNCYLCFKKSNNIYKIC